MPILLEKLPQERAEHAQWAIAVQWGRKHEFARANNLALPWFDHAIRLRYPEGATPLAGPVKLRTLDESAGWLGSVDWAAGSPTIAPFDKFPGDKASASWFPNAFLAHAWQAFVNKPSNLSLKRPAGLGDGQPFAELSPGQPLEIEAALRGPADAFTAIEVFAGDQPLGKLAPGATTAKLAPLPPGIHVLLLSATNKNGSRSFSAPNVVIVGSEKLGEKVE